MSKYTIEGNINFKEELYKLLDEDSENEDDLCQITGLPLKDKYVVLECKHHFNYDAIYKEIYKQKYEFRGYELHTLVQKDLHKFRESKLDYFIKCPYCRNIQFTILPYYEELNLKEIYGINSLNKNLPNTIIINNSSRTGTYHQNQNYSSGDYVYKCWGVPFKHGKCCIIPNSSGNECTKKYVGTIPNTQLSYCKYHYKEGLNHYKIYKKNKMLESKLATKKEKDDKMNERKKLLEEKNAERELNGLPPLKRLYKKQKVENIVEQGQTTIKKYVPEEENGCSAILKFGLNKGKKCGCKKLEAIGLCKRHSSKDNKK